jgi:hypothetical protein
VTRHIDAEMLARYDEGDIRPWQSWRIRLHLTRCVSCRALNIELAGITTLLASVPEPTMPDYLYARIELALAHEVAIRATSAAEPVTSVHPDTESSSATAPAAQDPTPARPEPDDGTGGRNRGSARRWLPKWSPAGSTVALRVTAAAVVALVVIGVGSYELTQLTGSTHPPAPSAPNARPAAGAAPNVGNQPPTLQYTHSGQRDTIIPINTPTDFTHAQLANQLRQIATAPPVGHSTLTGPNAKSSSAPAKMFGNIPVSSLDGCVNRIAAGNLVLLVDVAEFQGTRAIVILTEAADIGPEKIWVVGTGCSASASDVLDQSVLPAGG